MIEEVARVFRFCGVDVICLSRLAAFSDIVIVMAAPSSSLRGFFVTIVALRTLVEEKSLSCVALGRAMEV